MNRERIVWITRTALLLALTIAAQTVFRMIIAEGISQTFIIGSTVNLLLITAAVTGGFWSGFVVAVFTPIMALIQGHIPPFPQMAVAVAVGNLTLVLVFCTVKILQEKKFGNDTIRLSVLTVIGALLKSAVLYVGVVKIVIPTAMGALPPAKKVAISMGFSWPQIVTAIIGGIIFTLIYPTLKKAIRNNK